MSKVRGVSKVLIGITVIIIVLPYAWKSIEDFFVKKTGWVLINTLGSEKIDGQFETDSACILYLKIHENRKGDGSYICGKGCVYDSERQKFLCDKYCGELFCSSKK